jgi:hypothetical protein
VIVTLLVVLGVPLWLCAIAPLVLVPGNRSLRHRPGNMPVRVLRPGKTRCTRGHAIWVSNVFAWRGSPAAWREELARVVAATVRTRSRENTRRCTGWGTPLRSESY